MASIPLEDGPENDHGRGSAVMSPFCECEAILFDLDGTLVRSDCIHEDAFREVLADYGICSFDYSVYAGRRTRDVLTDVFRANGVAAPPDVVDVATRRKQDLARARLAAGPELTAGAREFVTTAASRGFRLAVATSASRAGVEAAISGAGLRSHFETIVSGDDVARAKPAPDVWVEALKRLGVGPSKAVAIEDSEAGVLSARAAGLEVFVIQTPASRKLGGAALRARAATFDELSAMLLAAPVRTHASKPGAD